MQGNVDLSFRIKGHKGLSHNFTNVSFNVERTQLGAGTVYFTSIRKAKGQQFTICTYLSCAPNIRLTGSVY